MTITLSNLTKHYGTKHTPASPVRHKPALPINRVWIYTRTSYDPRHEEKSCDTQADILLQYAKTCEWMGPNGIIKGLPIGPDAEWKGKPFPAVIKETDVSAGKAPQHRPKGSILYKLLKPGDHVLITRISRLWRSKDFRAQWERFQEMGVTIHSVRDYNGPLTANNAFTWLMINLKALLDELERIEVADRTAEMHARKKARGERVGGSPGLGKMFVKLHRNRNIWNVVINIDELRLIDKMLEWSESGQSVRKITDHVNAIKEDNGEPRFWRHRVQAKKGAKRNNKGRVDRGDLTCVRIPWSPKLVYQAIILAKKVREEGRTMEALTEDNLEDTDDV